MISIVNLTPHVVTVMQPDGKTPLVTVKPDGTVARVKEEPEMVDMLPTSPDGWPTGIAPGPLVPVYRVKYGKVEGLPSPAKDTVFIVSFMVKQACPERDDVFSPYGLYRNELGQPIGCKGLC